CAACGVPKLRSAPSETPICRHDTNLRTPHARSGNFRSKSTAQENAVDKSMSTGVQTRHGGGCDLGYRRPPRGRQARLMLPAWFFAWWILSTVRACPVRALVFESAV